MSTQTPRNPSVLRKNSGRCFMASQQSSTSTSPQRPDTLKEMFPGGFTVTSNDSKDDGKSRTATLTDTSAQSGTTDDNVAASDQTS